MNEGRMKMNELRDAIYRGDRVRIEALLQEGADINGRDPEGRSPLMLAVLAANPNPELVEFLLLSGADPRVQDRRQRWSALHFAARDRRTRIAELLLDHGAEVDSLDCFGNTPLWRAVMGKVIDLDLIRLLLEKGADPDRANDSGIAPRTLASEKEVLKALFR